MEKGSDKQWFVDQTRGIDFKNNGVILRTEKIAAENKQSQKESDFPTINLCELLVSGSVVIS